MIKFLLLSLFIFGVFIVFSSSTPLVYSIEQDVTITSGTSTPGCEKTNSCYSPSSITIDVGDTIRWKNNDFVSHSIASGSTATGLDGEFNSGLFDPGKTFSHTFTQAGTYNYFDLLHPWMEGVIVVQPTDVDTTKFKESLKPKFRELAKKFREKANEPRTYQVYVQSLPKWASYADGSVEKAIEFWEKNENVKFELLSEEKSYNVLVKWVKDFGFDRVGHAYNQAFVEVALGDSRCWSQWNPFHFDYISNVMTHEFGHVLGYSHGPEPYPIMDTPRSDKQYGPTKIENRLSPGMFWYIPICSINDQTTFNYHITTDDPYFGFNVEILPSKEDLENKRQRIDYEIYEDCSSYGVKEISGICNLTKDSWLTMTAAKDLSKATAKFFVTLEETKTVSGSIVYDKEIAPTKETPTESYQTGGGGCLIATATFGSEFAPQVQMLREIRDNKVLLTNSGTSFMAAFNEFYYSFSPTIADWERQNAIFKEAVKITITPLLMSLSILNYVDIDSEGEMLGYGIGIIFLNIGMYFVAPAVVIIRLKNSF